ncbi:hypothetical protein Mgra_00003463 [Meloidogyne graminicola]|uniref:Uncharacterized protein n=1 Tax=Meloidogyne graminicola TaxID=189291 RepID=A0A8S9ZTP1_9BILA|nr:hypothetical protein Mgra_00003463 [Meloidogyne graminicola]
MPQHPMPPAYNPAFKVNQAESGEEQSQAESRNSNMVREQPPFEAPDQNRENEKQREKMPKPDKGRNNGGGYSDDNLLPSSSFDRQTEKPKVYGLSQQKAQHFDFNPDSASEAIEMRNHLRNQLKSRKARMDDTE